MSILSEILATAAAKPGFSMRVDTEETVRRVIPEPQADVRRLSLRTLEVSEVLSKGSDVVLPTISNLETKNRVAADVIQLSSRTVAAGARIVLIQDAPKPIQDSTGKITMVQQPAGFIVAEPAAFAKVADGSNVSTSDVPAYRALMDRSVAPGFMFRTVLSRREQKSWLNGELETAVLLSILFGVGRIVDKVLLDAITADTPSTFSIGAAAARGLQVEGLRALVGTSGAGATFRGDGVFVAANIPAELTREMTGTIIGDFSRAAVGLFEDITLIGQRFGVQGEMAVTCIANADALLPVNGPLLPFWTVSV